MRKPATLGTILPPILAFSVAATLFAAYIAPFYGALDRDPASGDSQIITEDFQMPEDMPPERLPSGTLATGQNGEAGTGAESPLPNAAETQQNAPLERIEPRPPLSDLGLAAPVQEKPPVTQTDNVTDNTAAEQKAAEGGLFYRPVALAAGRLAAGNRTIELAGIDIIEPDAACADINGDVWQCGMQARTAFRAWLRSRTVTCNMSGIDQNQELIRTTCSIADTDIARWLVENGWARATFGGAYADAQAQAEKMLLGVFGRKPATDLPLSSEQNTLVPALPFDPVPSPNIAPVESTPSQPAQSDLPFPPAPQ